MYLKLENVTKYYADKAVVSHLSLEVSQGELLCILGSSGCGKTTTLNMIGGFVKPDEGNIFLDGAKITNLPPEVRPVCTVFQSYALFPHMNVLQNVMYGLKFQHIKKNDALKKAYYYLEMVGLTDYAKSSIHEISGGQQQRVALARALAVEPKLLLLDEPFSNLDAALRVRMRNELKSIQKKLDITMVFVTHDQEEAFVLADQMAIMNQGILLQNGKPEEIYHHPKNDFIYQFLNLKDISFDSDGSLWKKITDYN